MTLEEIQDEWDVHYYRAMAIRHLLTREQHPRNEAVTRILKLLADPEGWGVESISMSKILRHNSGVELNASSKSGLYVRRPGYLRLHWLERQILWPIVNRIRKGCSEELMQKRLGKMLEEMDR